MIKQEFVDKEIVEFRRLHKNGDLSTIELFRLMGLILFVFFCSTSLNAEDRDKNCSKSDSQKTCLMVKND